VITVIEVSIVAEPELGDISEQPLAREGLPGEWA
jgi:hypothetical protein